MKCFSRSDADLVSAVDLAWKKGFFDYYQKHKTDWGKPGHDEYKEGKSSSNMKKFGDVDVYEPCNYSSSVSFYRGVTRVCDYTGWNLDETYMKEVKRSFANLAFGRALKHSSHSDLGDAFGDKSISIVLYLAHQLSVQHIPDRSPTIQQLSIKPRYSNAPATSNILT